MRFGQLSFKRGLVPIEMRRWRTMGWKRWVALKLALVGLAMVTIAAPAVFAQTPFSNTPAGVSVQKTETIEHVAGHPIGTERPFANAQLAKKEVTVTGPTGRVVSKAETVFNAAGQITKEVSTKIGRAHV